MLGDQRELLMLLAACVAVSAVLTLFFRMLRPKWSSRTVIVLAAAPLPTVVLLLCLYVFLNAAFATKEECGVDACGMAMGFSMIISVAAVAAFGIGALSAWLIHRFIAP